MASSTSRLGLGNMEEAYFGLLLTGEQWTKMRRRGQEAELSRCPCKKGLAAPKHWDSSQQISHPLLWALHKVQKAAPSEGSWGSPQPLNDCRTHYLRRLWNNPDGSCMLQKSWGSWPRLSGCIKAQTFPLPDPNSFPSRA